MIAETDKGQIEKSFLMFFYRPKKEELEELIRAAMQGVDAPPSE
ncbi:MAG: hypothetical protein PVF56_19840 [Desulfobacterales bacterium]|jgi:hypothetical protein